MEPYELRIIQTSIAVILFLLVKYINKKVIKKVGIRFNYQSNRIKITTKISNVLLFVALFTVIVGIWGVEKSQLLVFLSTLATILGVALFAQWSILSNITSTLIIFFNHPIKIGDSLTIMDKEYPIEGTLNDIGIFFVIIKTNDHKKITIPSNVFMQKMIKKEEN